MSRWIAKRLAKPFVPMFKELIATEGALCKAFYEKYGEEALPIIAEVMGKAGVEHGKISHRELRGKGMKAIGERFQLASDIGLLPRLEMIGLSDDMIHYKHPPPCARGLEGTAKGLCEAVENQVKKMFSTLLGQEVEMEILKCVAAGDEYCEVIYSIKK